MQMAYFEVVRKSRCPFLGRMLVVGLATLLAIIQQASSQEPEYLLAKIRAKIGEGKGSIGRCVGVLVGDYHVIAGSIVGCVGEGADPKEIEKFKFEITIGGKVYHANSVKLASQYGQFDGYPELAVFVLAKKPTTPCPRWPLNEGFLSRDCHVYFWTNKGIEKKKVVTYPYEVCSRESRDLPIKEGQICVGWKEEEHLARRRREAEEGVTASVVEVTTQSTEAVERPEVVGRTKGEANEGGWEAAEREITRGEAGVGAEEVWETEEGERGMEKAENVMEEGSLEGTVTEGTATGRLQEKEAEEGTTKGGSQEVGNVEEEPTSAQEEIGAEDVVTTAEPQVVGSVDEATTVGQMETGAEDGVMAAGQEEEVEASVEEVTGAVEKRPSRDEEVTTEPVDSEATTGGSWATEAAEEEDVEEGARLLEAERWPPAGQGYPLVCKGVLTGFGWLQSTTVNDAGEHLDLYTSTRPFIAWIKSHTKGLTTVKLDSSYEDELVADRRIYKKLETRSNGNRLRGERGGGGAAVISAILFLSLFLL